MCVVVDTNSRKCFMDENNPSAVPLREWLRDGKGKLLHVESGRWLKEHGTSSAEWKTLVREYGRVGILKTIPTGEFNATLTGLPEKTKSGEKDKHVLALALAGGARLLYSDDNNLRDDFKNIAKGKIYPGVGGQSNPNSDATIRRCRNMLKDGGLCDHGVG